MGAKGGRLPRKEDLLIEYGTCGCVCVCVYDLREYGVIKLCSDNVSPGLVLGPLAWVWTWSWGWDPGLG